MSSFLRTLFHVGTSAAPPRAHVKGADLKGTTDAVYRGGGVPSATGFEEFEGVARRDPFDIVA